MGRANVAGKGFAHVSISNAVAAKIASFIETNEWGYRSRAEVVTAAIREFIEGEGRFTREDMRKALLAAAATEPETVEDLVKALLAELDMRQASGNGPAKGGDGPRGPPPPGRGRPSALRQV